MRKLGLLIVGFLTLAAAGCNTSPQSDYSAVDLVPATGTVTLDGQPLANAVVTFDAENGQFAYGQTNASGYYELHFDTVVKGVTPGPKVVRISTTRKILGLNSEEEGGESSAENADGQPAAPANRELVPEKFNTNSVLTAEVTLEQTVYDFDLQTGGE